MGERFWELLEILARNNGRYGSPTMADWTSPFVTLAESGSGTACIFAGGAQASCVLMALVRARCA